VSVEIALGFRRVGFRKRSLGLRAPMLQAIFGSFVHSLLPCGPFAAGSKIDHLAHAKTRRSVALPMIATDD